MDRITQTEIKIAYLEDFLNQINEVVRRQDEELSQARETIRLLTGRLRDMEEIIREERTSAPPPHY